MTRTRLTTLLLATLLAGTGLAGCFQPGNNADPGSDDEQEEIPSFALSREYRISIDEETPQELDSADPMEALRSLMQTSWVVRVGEAGDYTLSYTGSDGKPANKTLTGLRPGEPVTVPGVDPLSGATLKKGSDTKAQRAAVAFDGFTVDGVPVGVWAGQTASSTYSYSSDGSSSFELRDVVAEEEGETTKLHLAKASFNVPVRGTLGWTAAPDGGQTRVDLRADMNIRQPGSESLLVIEFDAEGEDDQGQLRRAEGGFEIPSLELLAAGNVTFWVEDDAVTAFQSQGGHLKMTPKAYGWLTGEGSEELAQDAPPQVSDCVGKTRAQRCEVDLGDMAQDQTFEAGPREDAPETTEDAEKREAIDTLQKLFAQDIGLGDRFLVEGRYSQDNDGGEFDVSFDFEVYVPRKESLTVPAGTFEAFVITQEMRFVADVAHVSESQYDDETGRSTQEAQIRNLDLNETVARTTLWLDAKTWQPLKVESTTPMDMDAVLDKVLRATTDAAWEDSPIGRLAPEQIDWTIEGTTLIQATKISGEHRFAPQMGLFLGSMLGGSVGALMGPSMGAIGGFPGSGHAVAEPVPPPYPYPYPTMTTTPPTWGTVTPRALSVSSGNVSDGAATFVVTRASEDFYWYELGIMVNGESYYEGYVDDCATEVPEEGAWVFCEEDGDYAIGAGETIVVSGVSPGDEVDFVDGMSGMTLTRVVV